MQGHWDDLSSQLHTTGLKRFTALDMTQTKRTNRTLAYYVPDPSLPIVSTSRAENHDVAGVDGYLWRNVSFALLWPYVEFGPNTLTIQSGVQRRDAVYSSSSSSNSSNSSSSSIVTC